MPRVTHGEDRYWIHMEDGKWSLSVILGTLYKAVSVMRDKVQNGEINDGDPTLYN